MKAVLSLLSFRRFGFLWWWTLGVVVWRNRRELARWFETTRRAVSSYRRRTAPATTTVI